MENYKNNEIYQIFQNELKIEFGKVLGKGGFGEVREYIKNGEKYGTKIIKKKKNDSNNSEKLGQLLNNPNVIKIYKIHETKKYNQELCKQELYRLVLMEKAILKDLKYMIGYFFKTNYLRLINIGFSQKISDLLLVYFTKQIISGLEAFNRNEFVHFDLKPDNILVFLGLKLKISDFDLLKDIHESKSIFLPGGTPGYLSPEFYAYKNEKVSTDICKKQDYFSLGTTIFFIKYGRIMIKLNKHYNDIDSLINQESVVESILDAMAFIQSDYTSDKDFISFICSLITIIPEERPTFEEIYRNKWVNKNKDLIKKIFSYYGNKEAKLCLEMNKHSFLIDKKDEIRKNKNRGKKFVYIPNK